MLTNKIFAAATIFVATSLFVSTYGQIKCKGVEIKIHPNQMKNMKDCADSVGIKDKESMTPQQMGCMAKCVLEKKLLLDTLGKPHKENILKFVESAIPDNVKAELTAQVAKCLDTHGIKIDPSDAACATYVPLAACLHAIWTDFCKS